MRFNGILAALAAGVVCCPVTVHAAPPATGATPRPLVLGESGSLDARRLIATKRESFGEPEAIFGACCFQNGECHVIGIVGCIVCGGAFQGFGSDCADVDCMGADPAEPATLGACCFDDGSCTECLPFLCCILGGEYQGFGSSCDDACGGRGACCYDDNQCIVVGPLECEEMQGVFLGPGTECEPNNETYFMGSFFFNGGQGSSAEFDLADNDAQVVGFRIDFNYVEPVPDQSWASDLRVVVTGPGDLSLSIGGFETESDVPWPFQGPESDGDGSYGALFELPPTDKGIWVVTLTNDWAGDPNPNDYNDVTVTFVKQSVCAATGACCLPTGDCIQASQLACEEDGGVYQGDDTLCSDVCCVYTIDFETDDDFATPLVNGQDISTAPEFGNKIALHIVDNDTDNRGLAIFDSTPAGPNAGGGDEDLLVNAGNVLIIQDWFHPTQSVAGIFDEPNDSSNGGVFRIDFLEPSHPISIALIDICNAPGEFAVLTLTDSKGSTRVYTVPRGWTSDTDGGYRVLHLDTLAPQCSLDVCATAVEDGDFDENDVESIRVEFGASGAIDNLKACNPGNPLPPA